MKIDKVLGELKLIFSNIVDVSFGVDINGILKFKNDKDKAYAFSVLEGDYKRDKSYIQHDLTFQGDVDVQGLLITIDRSVLLSELGLNVFYNKDHFFDRNRCSLPDGLLYVYEINGDGVLDELNSFYCGFKGYVRFVELIRMISDKQESDFEFYISELRGGGVVFEADRGSLINDVEGLDDIFRVFKAYAGGKIDYTNEFKQILRQNILDFSNKYKSNKLSLLASKFSEFRLASRRDYHSFLSNFSFQKIKNSFVQEKSRYIEALDKYVVTVQNVVFSIPVSVGVALLVKNLDSGSLLEVLVLTVAFFFYSIVSVVIVMQNGHSVRLTKKMFDKERAVLQDISTCGGLFSESDDGFSEYFDIFDKKISLIQILSFIVIFVLVFVSAVFLVRLLVVIPYTHAILRSIAGIIDGIEVIRPLVNLIRYLF